MDRSKKKCFPVTIKFSKCINQQFLNSIKNKIEKPFYFWLEQYLDIVGKTHTILCDNIRLTNG